MANEVLYKDSSLLYDPYSNKLLYHGTTPSSGPSGGFWHNLIFTSSVSQYNGTYTGSNYNVPRTTNIEKDPSVHLNDQQNCLSTLTSNAETAGRLINYCDTDTGYPSGSSSTNLICRTEIVYHYSPVYILTGINVTNDGTNFTTCYAWSDVMNVLSVTEAQLQSRMQLGLFLLDSRFTSGVRYGGNTINPEYTINDYANSCVLTFGDNTLLVHGGKWNSNVQISIASPLNMTYDDIEDCNVLLTCGLPPTTIDPPSSMWGYYQNFMDGEWRYAPTEPWALSELYLSTSSSNCKIFI